MRIVKLGGSLYDTPELLYWLTLLSTHARREPVLIVPGGGPFADLIRQAQTDHDFDDQHAHHMALLAMSQFGIMLHALQPTAMTINKPAEMPTHNQLAIWLPDEHMLEVDELMQNWQVTSDSLALWFAQQRPDAKLDLVKRVSVTAKDIALLTHQHILDDSFHQLYQRQPVPSRLFYYQNWQDYPEKGILLR